jgi:hypothetical protein
VAALLLASAVRARGDGGAVLLRGSGENLDVTLFGAPVPLRVGDADLSVLVQDADGGATVLDAEVDLVLEPPAGSGTPEVRARLEAGHATNDLLLGATVALGAAGSWRARVEVARGGRRARVEAPVEVAPARTAVARLWPWLAIPFVANALFAWREWLRLGRARRESVSDRARPHRGP